MTHTTITKSNSPTKIKKKRRNLMRKHIKNAEHKISDLTQRIQFWRERLAAND